MTCGLTIKRDAVSIQPEEESFQTPYPGKPIPSDPVDTTPKEIRDHTPSPSLVERAAGNNKLVELLKQATEHAREQARIQEDEPKTRSYKPRKASGITR